MQPKTITSPSMQSAEWNQKRRSNYIDNHRRDSAEVMTNLITEKTNALEAYKQAKEEYLKNSNNENWKKFCDAKKACMYLGVMI